MDIILRREGKINGFAEKFTNKPDNISMKRARRYTTIQLDIIHTGDCLKILKTLPDDSVHCCVTSPPYYALRDYGMDAQIGRETTPKEYISRLTEVFAEVRRVLRPDGTLWLNISDTYAGKGNQGDFIDPKNPNGRTGQAVALNNKVEGCKPKDMIRVLVDEMDLYKFGVLLSLYTGIRIGELCALRWEDFDLHSSELKVRKTMQRIQNTENGATSKTKVIITEPKSSCSTAVVN